MGYDELLNLKLKFKEYTDVSRLVINQILNIYSVFGQIKKIPLRKKLQF